MGDQSEKIKIIFAQAHRELLSINVDSEAVPETSGLHHLLTDLGFDPTPINKPLTADQLADFAILVLGAPREELDPDEIKSIQHFVQTGHGLLLVADSATMVINPLENLNHLAEMAGLEFREYLNYPPTWLQVFSPHYITANIDRVKVEGVASIVSNDARDLAFTKATQTPIIACSTLGRGRVVAIGDKDLFATDLLSLKGNEILVTNIFLWLAFQNSVDVQHLKIPKTVKWGQSAAVVLELHNANSATRPQVECILESDVDALISEPARKERSIPPGETTEMRWTVCPQILGDQKLRLTIHVDGQPSLFFDRLLPGMRCEAPGYLTLQTTRGTNADEEPATEFQTGEKFSARGAFHWPTEFEPPPYQLKLEHTKGLIVQGHQPGDGIGIWHLKAVAPGEHTLTLGIHETGQSLQAIVKVRDSLKDQLTELRAAYIRPLDVEIAERLRTVDLCLSDEAVWNQPFKVLSPEEYIEKVYDRADHAWLYQVLNAARREQWYNLDLLNEVLSHFTPAYLPNVGSFAPYDPALVSHLARLHPTAKWSLEYNLLRSEESEDITVKQNIAAYLLHEKYGHGFFYTHTRLGQQMAILKRHGFPEKPDNERYQNKDYAEVTPLIKDSTVIVNEGFAAWMELTFLAKLDREVRQAVYPRRLLLLEKITGLYEQQKSSQFFQRFPPRFDSPYREGVEYLEFISENFNLYCAVRLFLIATNVELGISEDAQGQIRFEKKATEIKQRLLEAQDNNTRSHLRLRQIVELVYEHREELQIQVRKHHCPNDCEERCLLEQLVKEHLNWRVPYV